MIVKVLIADVDLINGTLNIKKINLVINFNTNFLTKRKEIALSIMIKVGAIHQLIDVVDFNSTNSEVKQYVVITKKIEIKNYHNMILNIIDFFVNFDFTKIKVITVVLERIMIFVEKHLLFKINQNLVTLILKDLDKN